MKSSPINALQVEYRVENPSILQYLLGCRAKAVSKAMNAQINWRVRLHEGYCIFHHILPRFECTDGFFRTSWEESWAVSSCRMGLYYANIQHSIPIKPWFSKVLDVGNQQCIDSIVGPRHFSFGAIQYRRILNCYHFFFKKSKSLLIFFYLISSNLQTVYT